MPLAPALTAAALASRLRLSGTLSLDPDLGIRLLEFQAVARQIVNEAAPGAPTVKTQQAVLLMVAFLHDKPSAAPGYQFANAFGMSGARSLLRRNLTRRAVPYRGRPECGSRSDPGFAGSPAGNCVRYAVRDPERLRFRGCRLQRSRRQRERDRHPRRSGAGCGCRMASRCGPPTPLEWLRNGLHVPALFSEGPAPVDIGGVSGRYWRTGIELRMWSASRLDVAVSGVSLTELTVAALVARATGIKTDPARLGVVAAAAGRLGRALALAEVAPDGSAELADLKPSLLHEVGRAMIYAGESLFLIEVVGGRVRLIPASSWDVAGTARRWSYRLDLSGPTGTESVFAPSESVLHFRINADASEPWRG